MDHAFQLQVALGRFSVVLLLNGPDDVMRMGVVPFDEVGVVLLMILSSSRRMCRVIGCSRVPSDAERWITSRADSGDHRPAPGAAVSYD